MVIIEENKQILAVAKLGDSIGTMVMAQEVL